MSVKTLLYRCGFAGAGLLLLLSTGTFGVGTTLAAPPSNSSSNTQLAIDGIYSSIVSAVNHHQNSSVIADIEQTGKILKNAKTDLSKLNDPSSPGTIVGGLDLDAYCASIGQVNSYTPDPGTGWAPGTTTGDSTGAAYTWECVATDGTQTPINMQDACNAQYPGQVTVAYPQDPNNSYSWVCLAPTTGTYTDPITGATVDSITTPTSDMTLITDQGSVFLAANVPDSSATAVLTAELQAQNSAAQQQFSDIMSAAQTSIFNTQQNAANNAAEAFLKTSSTIDSFVNQ